MLGGQLSKVPVPADVCSCTKLHCPNRSSARCHPTAQNRPTRALATLSLPLCLAWLITEHSVNITTPPFTFPPERLLVLHWINYLPLRKLRWPVGKHKLRVGESMRPGCYETAFQLSHVFPTQLLKQLYRQSYLGQEPNRVWRFQSSVLQPEIALPSIFTSSPASPSLR